MIRAREVSDHYRDVVATEQAILRSEDPLLMAGMHLPRIGGVVQSRGSLANNLSSIRPRPSHRLLISAFSALSDQGLDRNVRDSIGTFSDNFCLPLAGLTAPDDKKSYALTSSGDSSETCPQTEPTFIGALQQVIDLAEGKKVPRASLNRAFHRTISTYHAEDGTPLILRKRNNIGLGLILEDMRLDDAATLPAGTVVGFDRKTNGAHLEQSWCYKPPAKRSVEGFKLQSFIMDSQLAVRPLRITPWAYDNPLDRAVFGIDGPGNIDRGRATQVAAYSIEDFRAAAATIMELCTK